MALDEWRRMQKKQEAGGKILPVNDFLQDFSYARLGEKAGKKEIGNSWIWKDKYN